MSEYSNSLKSQTASQPSFGAIAYVIDCLALVLTAMLGISALVLAGRRLAGAFELPPDTPRLLVAGLLVITMSLLGRAAWQAAPQRSASACLFANFSISASLLITMAALTMTGENRWALALLWLCVIAEEFGTWRAVRNATVPLDSAPVRISSPNRGQLDDSNVAELEEDRDVAAEDREPAEDVLQQLTLSQRDDGGRQLVGWLRMPVAAGQRTGNIHVAFCPPFMAAPKIELEQLSGPSCRIRTPQVMPFGARLELKLDAVAELPDSILVRFSAEG